ncbi:hypothetical protein [Couchioplanes caeruleus]|uniref:2-amino-4-ketopentanoate thiolase n=2 Tax=Couchioplanes caeruleus TaxID=56438 RepID=A0A1K0FSR2_9ACTN|nr:hypothetical protein [Couchioplanes caeruleus]OJF15895.1 hypothetical protein BG844_01255 [Couchioplanes caeruleus subsp. caeruleus]ROP33543.1 hypothetical protein EDD30_6535 [Couchioplanes caeruleus]
MVDTDRLAAGAWVEIRYELIPAGARATDVPPDTADTAYTVRLRGWLVDGAEPGDMATVHTVTGRHRTGTLTRAMPWDAHTFGQPHPVLLATIEAIVQHLADLR